MVFIKLRKILPPFALGVLLLQVLGLLFCGDADCLQGEGNEVCQTLLCSLLIRHDHSQPLRDFSQDDSCQCACNLAFDVPQITLFSTPFVSALFFTESQLFLSTPISRIDHIPRA